MPGANSRRDDADRLDGQHARQVGQFVQSSRRAGFDEDHRVILTLREVELHVENHIQSVE
jgi:hypothetical protein